MICDGSSDQILNCHAYNNGECMNAFTCGGKVLDCFEIEISPSIELLEELNIKLSNIINEIHDVIKDFEKNSLPDKSYKLNGGVDYGSALETIWKIKALLEK